jgi:hypothetical protein
VLRPECRLSQRDLVEPPAHLSGVDLWGRLTSKPVSAENDATVSNQDSRLRFYASPIFLWYCERMPGEHPYARSTADAFRERYYSARPARFRAARVFFEAPRIDADDFVQGSVPRLRAQRTLLKRGARDALLHHASIQD